MQLIDELYIHIYFYSQSWMRVNQFQAEPASSRLVEFSTFDTARYSKAYNTRDTSARTDFAARRAIPAEIQERAISGAIFETSASRRG